MNKKIPLSIWAGPPRSGKTFPSDAPPLSLPARVFCQCGLIAPPAFTTAGRQCVGFQSPDEMVRIQHGGNEILVTVQCADRLALSRDA